MKKNASKTAKQPVDGKGCESVTVVIVQDNDSHALVAARSVKKNLTGVDALVVRLQAKDGLTKNGVLLRFLQETEGTERIILMTDSMIILNPVTLGDVQVVKAVKVGTAGNDSMILNFNTRTPVLMHRSALLALLTEAKEAGQDYIDVVDAYFKAVLPEGHQPVLIGDWHSDPWLLPAISKNPSIEALSKYGQWKKFMHVGPDSWSESVEKFLEERFPES